MHLPQEALAMRTPEARSVIHSAFNLDLFQGIDSFLAGFALYGHFIFEVLLKRKLMFITNNGAAVE